MECGGRCAAHSCECARTNNLRFAQFADTVSEYAAWPTGCAAERVVLWLLRIVSFPLSRLFLHSRRCVAPPRPASAPLSPAPSLRRC